ncbi:ATP-dependent DNA helicase RecG [Pontivivens insulae]|uniref:ATP-dependent DNA helicase RecG n=1 Tax=Pontivivens insulae TaxID=1639689 RepID=A0A2R8ABJ0_9RHOB|nr:ATP-dependent DNA helicase RecG [Pontivivens insulae]RED11389.1 ATP-dependent DNA helicase RecG [Pontivivens insulae]SPF29438.1 ATP-dependent DNA helicase RecG [Pontivivens insulae]
MSGRPEILFPLFGDMTGLPGVGPKTAPLYENLGVAAPRDLLFLLPTGGTDRRLKPEIRGIPLPATLTVGVEVLRHMPPSGKGRPFRVQVRDASTEFLLVWFHARADWIQRNLPIGARRIVSGKVELFDNVAQMVHPDHVLSAETADHLPPFEPHYPLTAGLTLKGLTKAMAGALERLPVLPEWIERSIVDEHKWPDWRSAVQRAHAPEDVSDLADTTAERQRLAYDEFFAHQLTLALARAQVRRKPGRATSGTGALSRAVLSALPYAPTGAQSRAVKEITSDMAAEFRMNRLLQGDVGSGKTLVAFLAMLAAVEAGGQAAFMAPTGILAQQHLEALGPLAAGLDLRIDSLTGRDKGSVRAAKLSALADGTTDILIGTHALFQKDVAFDDLRLAIIDEQHRFGVRERMSLGQKGAAADILVMTATPIPRSLSLAQYGDMDLSILDEKPPGRKPVETRLVSAGRLDEVVARIGAALDQGRQVYWVCPLVEESEVVDLAAAEDRYRALRVALGAERVGLIHGRLPPAEKDAAMADFAEGRTRLLVATTVIEVGVNVPSATIMVIEQAEHFGLSALHQLRGRVGRGADSSTCLLMYAPPLGETARARLEIMRETEDGFRIAEEDLRLRGAGDVLGLAQSGLPRFRVADLERQAGLMELAQRDARLLLERDPKLASDRGRAARTLLWLMGRDEAIRLISVG